MKRNLNNDLVQHLFYRWDHWGPERSSFHRKNNQLNMATEWPLILGNHLENSCFLSFPKVKQECGLHHIIITLLQEVRKPQRLLGFFLIASTFLTEVYVLILLQLAFLYSVNWGGQEPHKDLDKTMSVVVRCKDPGDKQVQVLALNELLALLQLGQISSLLFA